MSKREWGSERSMETIIAPSEMKILTFDRHRVRFYNADFLDDISGKEEEYSFDRVLTVIFNDRKSMIR